MDVRLYVALKITKCFIISVAFAVCTYLSVALSCWFVVEKNPDIQFASASSRLFTPSPNFSVTAFNGSTPEAPSEEHNERGKPDAQSPEGNVTVNVDANITNTDHSSRKEHTLEAKPLGLQNKTVQETSVTTCDVTKGKWVYDDSYPLYSPKCLFIDEGFDCYGNGRLNSSYMKWRWQPHDCEIPRFNASKMLEIIKGKRLLFVGDSLSRNQWESMVCLLMETMRAPGRRSKRITKLKRNNKIMFPDYKCSVEFRVAHFLVQESKTRVNKKRVQSLRIDKMDRTSAGWKSGDIVLFNTGHWWIHSKTNEGNNYFQKGDKLHENLNVKSAFKRALSTWAKWVDDNMNQNKLIFFRSFEPAHFRGGQWNSGGRCSQFTEPVVEESSQIYDHNVISNEVIREMKTQVQMLNITELSDYRMDGHPSRYSNVEHEDCSHWCLPGVPDTWNQLLYYYLLQKTGHIF